MKHAHSTKNDFFTRYNHKKLSLLAFSGMFAFVLSFGALGLIRGDIDTRGLMANVSQLSTLHADADLIVEKHTDTFVVNFGSRAENVDTLSFVLLTDPTRVTGVKVGGFDVIDQGEGVYFFQTSSHKNTLFPGENLGEISFEGDTQPAFSLVDAQFTSAGTRYALTSKVIR